MLSDFLRNIPPERVIFKREPYIRERGSFADMTSERFLNDIFPMTDCNLFLEKRRKCILEKNLCSNEVSGIITEKSFQLKTDTVGQNSKKEIQCQGDC